MKNTEIRTRVSISRAREQWREKKKRKTWLRDFPGATRDVQEWLEVINIATPSCFWPRWLRTPDDSVNRRAFSRVCTQMKFHRNWESECVHSRAKIKPWKVKPYFLLQVKYTSILYNSIIVFLRQILRLKSEISFRTIFI